MSDEIQRLGECVEHISLQFALYINCFVCVGGGAFFLFTAIYVNRDRTYTEQLIAGKIYLPVSIYRQYLSLVVQRFGVGLVIKRSLVGLPARALSRQLGQLSLPSLRGR